MTSTRSRRDAVVDGELSERMLAHQLLGAQRVLLTVQDSGPGIARELRGEIFDRFRQGRAAGPHSTGGTGLGLAIVKDFVDLHGGTITVTLDGELTFDGPYRLGRRRADDRDRPERDRRAVDRAFAQFGEAGRVGEDQLDRRRPVGTEVSEFGVGGQPVVGPRGALAVAQERLTDVAERDRLVVLERLDRGVAAGAVARPGAEQVREGGNVGMQIG